jgi:glycerophosphoryl diester phosphodiesterase
MHALKLVVAHRGDHSSATANTVSAFESAIRRGADMVESDVRRTADGELVLHHDDVVGNRLLASLHHDEAVRLAARQGYALPRVADLLALAAGRVRLNLELKEAHCAEALARLLFDHRFHVAEFWITSFEAPALAEMTEASPGVRTGLLVWDMNGAAALEQFRTHPVDFLAPDCALLDADTMAAAAKEAVPLLPWTVNDPSAMRTLLRAPTVMGIITDRLAEALDVRRTEATGRAGLAPA